MEYQPHIYQEQATAFILEHEASAIFLECGLGKTVITLTAINELMHNAFEVRKVLVVAPLRVAQTVWTEEGMKWDHLKHLRMVKVLGSESMRKEALNTPGDVYLINRENVVWLTDTLKTAWPFDMVVLDELSSFKSHRSKRFRALRKVRPFIKRITGLTGTPAPNGLLDLWPQVYLLDRGERLGRTMTGYRERYFQPDKRSRDVIFSYKPKEGAEDAIYRKLSDIALSMKSSDYLQVPERVDHQVMLEMPEKVRNQYRKLERDLLLPLLAGEVLAGSAAVLTNKLLQFTGGAVYDDAGRVQEIHEEKIKALEDLIEAANGKPVLVYYAYRHEKSRIKRRIPCRVLETPADMDDWNRGEIPVLLAHPASAGHGLNLQQGGSTIVWYGLPWSLELYLQANGRIHRQGQKETTVVHHLIMKDALDEDVMTVLARKESSQEALLEAVKFRMKKE
ncbi:MAG: DEAD/DEAH box helicase [Bacillota bacterium]|nr:DEAD/DEAH box helicase [Bacillota bacterium]MDW7677839.1 DEAD/DEAH box helicase [Bacillota bacterium]